MTHKGITKKHELTFQALHRFYSLSNIGVAKIPGVETVLFRINFKLIKYSAQGLTYSQNVENLLQMYELSSENLEHSAVI